MIQRQVFSNWRTLPGQGRLRMNSSVSGLSSLGSTVSSWRRDQEVPRQGRDVLAPIGQARNMDTDHVQAVEQVFAKLAGLHQRLQVLVGRGDDAHVHLDRHMTTHPVELAVGQDPQQAGLGVGGHVADLVENNVPPSACSKRPRRRLAAPVKAPFSWPNSSDSIKSFGIAAMFRAMKGDAARGLWRCRAWATNSLPVPDSPLISTVMLEWLRRPIARNTSCIAGASPMISGVRARLVGTSSACCSRHVDWRA